LVAAGVAAALAPLLTIDLTDERIAVLRLRDMPPRTLGVAWHAERYRSTALEAFRDAAVRLCGQLERQLATHAWRNEGRDS
jgi:DNA-binding transcriptional LysR family regulator